MKTLALLIESDYGEHFSKVQVKLSPKRKIRFRNSTILKNDREKNPKVKQVSESEPNTCETSFKDFESELKSVKV